jgi:putative ABC transport system permease protein
MFINWLGTLPNAAAQGLIWGIMAIGVYITYRILDIADLTVDGSICTGGATFAVLLFAGLPIPVCLLAAFLAGALAGLITGIFHTFLGIPAILAGILTQLMLWSINLKIMGKANLAIPGRNYKLWVSSLLPSWQSLVVLVAVVAVLILLLYWFFGTEYGTSLRATGNNPNMSRAQGINTSAAKIFGLVLSNGIVALAGAFLVQYQGACNITMGQGAIVIGLASIIIGDAVSSLISKNFAVRLLGVVIGGIVYFFVYQTVIFLGFDSDLLKLLSAIVVAIFLGFPYVKKTYFNKKKKEGTRHA